MSSVSLTYTLTNGTPADATQVQQNFVDLRDHANTELVQRDGAVAMTGPLTLSGDPSAASHAVRKAYMDGPYVHATNANGTVGVKDKFTTIPGWTEQKDTSSNFTPTTGVFIAPRPGVYAVSLTASLDGDDPTGQYMAQSLYRFRVAVVANGGGDDATPVFTHNLMVVSPWALSHTGSDDHNWFASESVEMNAQTMVFAEYGQEIRPQVSIGGSLPLVNPRTFASNLTIAWLHG